MRVRYIKCKPAAIILMEYNISKIRYDGKNIRKKIELAQRPTIEAAEILGIMLGDGGIYLDKKKKFHTTISFNKKEICYLNYVKMLFEKHFYPYSFGINELKDEFLLRNVSKCVGMALISMGLKEGNKVKNKVEIPEWIFSEKRFILSLLKGVFDTDGCIYRKYGNYSQIQFKSGCFQFTMSIRKALTALNFNPTKIQKELNHKNTFGWKIYLTKQAEIKHFFREVKPANKKHVLRYHNIIKNGAAGI